MNAAPWLVVAIGLLLAGCSKKQNNATASTRTNESASGNPITAPVDYLGAVAKAKHFSEKSIDTSSLIHAIQQFYTEEDRFPKDLQELVTSGQLAAVPPPPAGMRWGYNPQTGQVRAVPP